MAYVLFVDALRPFRTNGIMYFYQFSSVFTRLYTAIQTGEEHMAYF